MGVTLLTCLSAGTQHLGVCRLTPRPEYTGASFHSSHVHSPPVPCTQAPCPAPLLWRVQVRHPGAAGRGASWLRIGYFLIDTFPFALEVHVRSGSARPGCRGPLGIEALGCGQPPWPARPTYSWDVGRLSSNASMAASWVCDAEQVKPQPLHLSGGPRKVSLTCRQTDLCKACGTAPGTS